MAQSSPRLIEVSRLTSTDLPTIAAIHLLAFPESALSHLGQNAVCRYYAWQMNGPHESVVIGARISQQLVGFCVGGHFNGALSGFLRANWLLLTLLIFTHPWVLLTAEIRQRMRLAIRLLTGRRPAKLIATPAVLQPVSNASFGILAIATHPEWQGRGIGAALMTEAEALARRSGYSAMHLTVAVANSKAISFYDGLGWRLVSTGVDQHHLMLKQLAGATNE